MAVVRFPDPGYCPEIPRELLRCAVEESGSTRLVDRLVSCRIFNSEFIYISIINRLINVCMDSLSRTSAHSRCLLDQLWSTINLSGDRMEERTHPSTTG